MISEIPVNKFNQDQTELKATFGHELMHMAQFSVDPSYAFLKRNFQAHFCGWMKRFLPGLNPLRLMI